MPKKMGDKESSSLSIQAISSDWYVVLDDSQASIRVSAGSCLGVDAQGEVCFDPAAAHAAVVFEIAPDGAWITPLAGRVELDSDPILQRRG